VSFIGTGDEDWVELDFDLFERNRSRILEIALVDHYERLADSLGFDFEVETDGDGLVYVVVDGRRRFRAEVGRDDRLIFTGIPDPEGPL
jgi:hypothetical protein